MPVVLLAVMAFVALSAQAQTPPPATGVTVTIQPPDGGSPGTISTGDIPNGDMNTTYTVGTQRVAVTKGVSVLQLLAETDTDFDYATIEIARPDGSTLRLTKDQVEDIKPPGFYTDPQGVTRFIGPTGRNGSVAAKDYFEVSGSITLAQERETKLKVTISPSRKKIELGGKVTFVADVTGDEEGRAFYKWGYSGKPLRKRGIRVTEEFPKRDGVYKYMVAVGYEGSEPSATAVARITVGDPEKADDEQVGSGDATDGSESGGTTGSGGGSSYTPSYTPSTPSTPATPSPPPPTPSAKPPQPPDIATSGTTVEGNLLADVSDPPPSSILESAARAAQEGKQADDSNPSDGAGVSQAALSIAGVLALLGLGAGIESRQGRLPRVRLPRRAA